MFGLSVTFTFDTEHDARPADERVHAVQSLLRSLPGFINAEISRLDRHRFVVVSSWESQEAADAALGAPGVNAQLAARAGAVLERPDAIVIGIPVSP